MSNYKSAKYGDFKVGTNYEIYQNKCWVVKTVNNQKHLDYILFDSRGKEQASKTINKLIRIKEDE